MLAAVRSVMAEEARQGAGQGAWIPSPPSPPTPEKCFYASFKIFLNPDSRTNSIIGSDSEGQASVLHKFSEVLILCLLLLFRFNAQWDWGGGED